VTRRELLAALGTAVAAPAFAPPPAPVSIARCRSYDEDLTAILSGMFDQLGGLSKLVRGKTVTIKLNLTGSPALRIQGRALGVTHYTHPKTAAAMASLLDRAGARRVRFVESCWATAAPLEEYLLESGWNVRSLRNAASSLEFVNTNALTGGHKQYSRFKVAGGGLVFPAYDLHPVFEQTDVFVSMAKLKNHETCGVTLSMKNIFGITPASIYGDDAGPDQPNESPTKGRVDTCHLGKRQPASSSPSELNPQASRDPGYRMPRITAELNAARPIDIAFIDGVETIAGGEGPWNRNVRPVRPGILLLGANALSTDTVATAAMGYDPRAPRGQGVFKTCDNTLLLAEQLRLGSADLQQIDLRGLKLEDALYRFA
jgi:uncharacterized protein (DUF362 family)